MRFIVQRMLLSIREKIEWWEFNSTDSTFSPMDIRHCVEIAPFNYVDQSGRHRSLPSPPFIRFQMQRHPVTQNWRIAFARERSTTDHSQTSQFPLCFFRDIRCLRLPNIDSFQHWFLPPWFAFRQMEIKLGNSIGFCINNRNE